MRKKSTPIQHKKSKIALLGNYHQIHFHDSETNYLPHNKNLVLDCYVKRSSKVYTHMNKTLLSLCPFYSASIMFGISKAESNNLSLWISGENVWTLR